MPLYDLLDPLSEPILDLCDTLDRSSKETLIAEHIDESPDPFTLFVDSCHRLFGKHICPLCHGPHASDNIRRRFLCREVAYMCMNLDPLILLGNSRTHRVIIVYLDVRPRQGLRQPDEGDSGIFITGGLQGATDQQQRIELSHVPPTVGQRRL